MKSPYVTAIEAAQYWRIEDERGQPDLMRLYKFVRRNKVRAKRLGRSLRIHEDELEAHMKEVR